MFVSKFWTELFKLSGTKLAFTSAYHPLSDGQTEVTNRTLETYLRCFVTDAPRTWVQFLHLAEYWYSTSHHSAIRMSPFEALYGRTPPNVRTYIAGSTSIATLDETLSHRQKLLLILRDNLSYAQQRMRSQADGHREDRSFKVGDWALLRLQQYRQTSLKGKPHSKLSRRYFGPYKVLRTIGPVAYELELPSQARIHPVFHVSKLKPFHGVPPSAISPLTSDMVSTRVELQPIRVLGARNLQTPMGPRLQLLIQWQDLSELEATWEDEAEFTKTYPNFDLEDKVQKDRQSNDTSSELSKAGIEPKITKANQVGPMAEEPNQKHVRKPPNWLKDFITKGKTSGTT